MTTDELKDTQIIYELKIWNDILTPGSKFKVINDKRTYVFIYLLHHLESGNTKIKAMDLQGNVKYFRIEKVNRVIKKTSRAKKS